MDGKEALYGLTEIIGEDQETTWTDDKTSYLYLWEAAKRYVARTNCLTSHQDITTVADQINYVLDAKFLKLYLTDKSNRYYIRYYDQSNYSFITWKDYEDIIYANKIAAADAVDVPSHFSIRDKQSLYDQITGTATSDGDKSGGQCILADTEGLFITTDYVSPGDIIHNTTDASDGVVLSITDATHLVCALFGGTGNDWDSSDAYVIQPQGRFELILDPPPDDADDTIRVWYIESPEPVFSDYGMYRFSQQAMEAIIDYAAAKYKYRDDQPNFAKEFLANWDMKLKRDDVNLRPMIKRKGFSVSFKKRT